MIKLPPLEPPTKAEIERRRILFERNRRLRAEIGPIGIRSDDLIHLARAEAEISESDVSAKNDTE